MILGRQQLRQTNIAEGLSLNRKCYLWGCQGAVPLQHLAPVSYTIQPQIPMQSFNGIWVPLTGYDPCCTCTIHTHAHQAYEARSSGKLATTLRHYVETGGQHVISTVVHG